MALPESSSSALQSYIKRLWIHGFLAGAVVLLLILVICYFVWGWPFTAQETVEEAKPTLPQAQSTHPAPLPAPAMEPTPPPRAAAGSPAGLDAELSGVLEKLSQANQKKDLQELLDLYSPSFPNLAGKAHEISHSWATFDYLELSFELANVKSPAPGRASALVTWKIRTRQHRTREIKDTTKVYQVSFIRESGRWRIRSLEKAGKQDKPS